MSTRNRESSILNVMWSAQVVIGMMTCEYTKQYFVYCPLAASVNMSQTVITDFVQINDNQCMPL